MGIINVTPDSFSDGGRWLESSTAIDHGFALMADGADLVDIGGESTRPGAERILEDEELRRVIPVVSTLANQGVPVSIDTMLASVARAAVEAGAAIVNDFSGGAAVWRADVRRAEAALRDAGFGRVEQIHLFANGSQEVTIVGWK